METTAATGNRGRWFVSLLSVIGVLLCGLLGWLWGRVPNFPAPGLPVGWTPGCPIIATQWRNSVDVSNASPPNFLGYLRGTPPIRLLAWESVPSSNTSDADGARLVILDNNGQTLARGAVLPAISEAYTMAAGQLWTVTSGPQVGEPAGLTAMDPETLAILGRFPLPALDEGVKHQSYEVQGVYGLPDQSLALIVGADYSTIDRTWTDWLHFDTQTHRFDASRALPPAVSVHFHTAYTGTRLYQISPTELRVATFRITDLNHGVSPVIDLTTGGVSHLDASLLGKGGLDTVLDYVMGDENVDVGPPRCVSTPRAGYQMMQPQPLTEDNGMGLTVETSLPEVLSASLINSPRSFHDALLGVRRLGWSRQLDGDLDGLIGSALHLDGIILRLDPADPDLAVALDPDFVASVNAVAVRKVLGADSEYGGAAYAASRRPSSWTPPPPRGCYLRCGLNFMPAIDGDRSLLVQCLPVPLPDLGAPYGLLRFGWVKPGDSAIDWWQALPLPGPVTLDHFDCRIRREHRLWGVEICDWSDPAKCLWTDFTVAGEQFPAWSGYRISGDWR
ncbi:MAG: hypothetical protein ABI743_04380 [bacterium]